jgi:hypothetical protein
MESTDKAGAGVEGADGALQELLDKLFLRKDAADGQREIDEGLELKAAPVAIE